MDARAPPVRVIRAHSMDLPRRAPAGGDGLRTPRPQDILRSMKASFVPLAAASFVACGAQAVVRQPASSTAANATSTGASPAGASAAPAPALPTAGHVFARSSSPTDARVRLGDE